MKNFIKLNLILFLSGILLVGCNKKNEEIDEEQNARFFDIVYQVIATRETSTHAWVNVAGTYQIKFNQQNSTQGTFTFFYQNYREPQFSNPVCSGGITGNFDQTNTGDSSSSGGDDDEPYDPSTPYPNPGEIESPTDPGSSEDVAEIIFYNFNLNITGRDLDASCRLEANRSIQVYRFAIGDLIMKNEYRELYLIPVRK